MIKKLPNIFKGKAPNNVNQETTIIGKEIIENEKDVNTQIKDIFSSNNFVYKAETQITYMSGEVVKKTIIGKTNNSLITMDDELIDVSKISKIELI